MYPINEADKKTQTNNQTKNPPLQQVRVWFGPGGKYVHFFRGLKSTSFYGVILFLLVF